MRHERNTAGEVEYIKRQAEELNLRARRLGVLYRVVVVHINELKGAENADRDTEPT